MDYSDHVRSTHIIISTLRLIWFTFPLGNVERLWISRRMRTKADSYCWWWIEGEGKERKGKERNGKEEKRKRGKRKKRKGAKINLLKSNGIAVNQPTPPLDLRLGMCWPSPDTTIEYLGVPVGLAVNYKEEWNIVKDKLTKKAGNWKRRNLSLQGKVLIIKTALLPKLQYLAFAIPAGDPKELEKLIWGYLWNDKKGYHCSEHHFPPKISWRTRYGIPLRLSGLTSSQGLPEGIESDRSPLDRIREGTSLSSCTGKWNLGLEELLCSCFPASQKQICLIFWKECLRDWQRLWGWILPRLITIPCWHNPSSTIRT